MDRRARSGRPSGTASRAPAGSAAGPVRLDPDLEERRVLVLQVVLGAPPLPADMTCTSPAPVRPVDRPIEFAVVA